METAEKSYLVASPPGRGVDREKLRTAVRSYFIRLTSKSTSICTGPATFDTKDVPRKSPRSSIEGGTFAVPAAPAGPRANAQGATGRSDRGKLVTLNLGKMTLGTGLGEEHNYVVPYQEKGECSTQSGLIYPLLSKRMASLMETIVFIGHSRSRGFMHCTAQKKRCAKRFDGFSFSQRSFNFISLPGGHAAAFERGY